MSFGEGIHLFLGGAFIFFKNIHPDFLEDCHFDSNFSDGLVQPPNLFLLKLQEDWPDALGLSIPQVNLLAAQAEYSIKMTLVTNKNPWG